MNFFSRWSLKDLVVNTEQALHKSGLTGSVLGVYLDDPKLEEKIYSMKPTVEVWQGELWGVLEVESHNQLSEREIEAVKEYWEGQESDGWGEGFEQRGIKIPEGELYVSFWNSGNEFFLTTEEGLKGEEREPVVQKGGIVFGAL